METTSDKKDTVIDYGAPGRFPGRSVDPGSGWILEEKFDKLISLIETQNKAWQKCLTLLTEMNTSLFKQYNSEDMLLEKHPSVKGPAPVTVGSAAQPQPFNDYSDSIPYGVELEAERDAPDQSFPATQRQAAQEYNDEQVSAAESASESASENTGVENSTGLQSSQPQTRTRITPGPAVSSKAELLERVEKV